MTDDERPTDHPADRPRERRDERLGAEGPARSAPGSEPFSWAGPETADTPSAADGTPRTTASSGPEPSAFRPGPFLGGLVLGVPFTWMLQFVLVLMTLGGQGDQWFWWVGFGVPVALAIVCFVKSGRDGRAGFLAGLGAGFIVAAGVCAGLLNPGIGG